MIAAIYARKISDQAERRRERNPVRRRSARPRPIQASPTDYAARPVTDSFDPLTSLRFGNRFTEEEATETPHPSRSLTRP